MPVCGAGLVAVKVCNTPIQCRQKCGLLGYDCTTKSETGVIRCNVCNRGRTLTDDGQCCDSEKIHKDINGKKICCTRDLCNGTCCGPTESCDASTKTCKTYCGSSDNICDRGEICVSTDKLAQSDIEALQTLASSNPSSKVSKPDENGIVHFCLKKGTVSFAEPNYMPPTRPSNHSDQSNPTHDSQNVYPCFLFDDGAGPESDIGFCTSTTENNDKSANTCFVKKTREECQMNGSGCKWLDLPTELSAGEATNDIINGLSKKYEFSSGGENKRDGRYCLSNANERRLSRFVVQQSNQQIDGSNHLDGFKACIESMGNKQGLKSVSFKKGPGEKGYCIGTVNCNETLPVCNADGPNDCPIDNIYTETDTNGVTRYPYLTCENQQLVENPDICLSDEDPCMIRVGDPVVEPGECLSLKSGQFQCTKVPWFKWPFGDNRSDCKGFTSDGDGNNWNRGNKPRYTLKSMREQITRNTNRKVNSAGAPDNVTNRSLFKAGGPRLWADGSQFFMNNDANDCHFPDGGAECYNSQGSFRKDIPSTIWGGHGHQYECHSCYNPSKMGFSEAYNICMDGRNETQSGRSTES